MKIGIITFHDDINYGAFLQTFALKKTIDSFGNKTSVINYKNIKHSILLNAVLYHRFWMPKYVLGNLKKAILFHKSSKELNLTKAIYFPKKLQKNDFDIIVYGSDEIWNFTNKLYGLDLTYFGKYIKSKKIAYAPSFGPVSNHKIIPKEITHYLKKLDCLSVRDANSQSIVKHLVNKKPMKVLDPTFLYDFSHEIKCSNIEINSRFILIYLTNVTSKHKKEILEFAQSKKLKTISLGFYHDWCDENHINIGPFDFLKLFQKSKFVVTNTFHGTIFSIKFKKIFATILSDYRRNKIYDLINTLSLKNQIVETSKKININKTLDNKNIFNNNLNKILKKEIKKSKKYLKESISKKL